MVEYSPDSARTRLVALDGMLAELESLNLAERKHLPIRLGDQLTDAGVEHPYSQSIPDLIERVFELQADVLELIRTRRARRLASLRLGLVRGDGRARAGSCAP